MDLEQETTLIYYQCNARLWLTLKTKKHGRENNEVPRLLIKLMLGTSPKSLPGH